MGHNRAHNNDHPHLVVDQPNLTCTISNNIFEFYRLNPTSFDDGPNPMVVKSRIMQIEKLFIVIKLTKEQRAPLVSFMFRGEAEHWWRLKKETLPTPILPGTSS